MKETSKSDFLTKICLFIIALYLILGNIPRIVQLPALKNSIAITEIILYFVMISFALLNMRILVANLTKIGAIACIIVFSFCYGVLINGFEFNPLLYSVRLILILLSANIAGNLLFNLYKRDLIKGLNFILNIYLGLLLISIAIYLIFPNSVDLWNFLFQFGITINGDPHQKRFVSSYFDPNFYGAIVLIPMIISAFLFKETYKRKFLFLLIAFSVSLYLTYSRSGLGAALILLLVILVINFFKKKKKGFKLRNVVLFWSSLPIVLLLLYFNIDKLRIIDRFLNLGSDASALARLTTFHFGFNIFSDNPLMGIGYDYLGIRMSSFTGITSVDSSLLAILINFGILFTFIMFMIFIYSIVKTRGRLKSKFEKKSEHLRFYDLFMIYVLISIVFTSQFNNLLLYQFWLFPCTMMWSYITHISKSSVQ